MMSREQLVLVLHKPIHRHHRQQAPGVLLEGGFAQPLLWAHSVVMLDNPLPIMSHLDRDLA